MFLNTNNIHCVYIDDHVNFRVTEISTKNYMNGDVARNDVRSELIVKDNALIEASYALDLTEQRLILLAIIVARESGRGISENDFIEIHAATYMQQFNVDRHAAYKALKTACKALFKRTFKYQTIDEKYQKPIQVECRWVHKVGYMESQALVKISFAPDLVPLITRLEEKFTSYEIHQISQLTSTYALRLYELLIQWRSVGQLSLDLQPFREKLGIKPTEYKLMHQFKSRVLDTAINQVNDLTDLNVSYTQRKEGRTIVGFDFKFAPKNRKAVEKKNVKIDDEGKKDGKGNNYVWNTPEKSLFKTISAKCPSLTPAAIEKYAQNANGDVLLVLQKLNIQFMSVDSFTEDEIDI